MKRSKLLLIAILTCGTTLQFSGCMSAARFLYRGIGNLATLLSGDTTSPGSTL